MTLLDTNICMTIINAKPAAVVERFKRYRQALEMFLAPLTIFPFDERAAWAYGELRADLKRRGTPIG